MAAPTVGPCEDWTSRAEIAACPECGDLPIVGSGDPDPVEAAIDFANQILFNLSGRQFKGACPRTVRPCLGTNQGCVSPGWGSFEWLYPSVPVRLVGGWVNCGSCCGACSQSCIKLPGVINAVTEVWLNGSLMDPADYHVEGFSLLCRDDGGTWPCSQNLDLPVTDPNTWQITYTQGRPITAVMRGFATRLACEYLNTICGPDSCLPADVAEIVRDDVTVTFEDTATLFTEGRTGIDAIDLWIMSLGIGKRRRASRVVRPDDPTVLHRTT